MNWTVDSIYESWRKGECTLGEAKSHAKALGREACLTLSYRIGHDAKSAESQDYLLADQLYAAGILLEAEVEKPWMYHYVWLRNGFEMHLSRAYTTERERDLEMAQMWASSNCQTYLDLFPAKRKGPDSPADIGPRYSDETLGELFEECRHIYGTQNRRNEP